MTLNISTYMPQPMMLPWVENLKHTEYYRPCPRYFWWKVLKEFPCCLIKPIITIQYPKIAAYMIMPTKIIDLPSEIVYWIFENVNHPYYMILDEEEIFRFYFTDQEEALWFKLKFG